MKNFEDILKGALGKRVTLNIIVQENPPFAVEGKLLEINKDHIVLEDCLTKSKIYVNCNFSAIFTIEVYGES